MTEEAPKIVSFKDGKVKVKFSKSLDPNHDGEPLGSVSFELELDLAEVADEAVDYWQSKKSEK